MPLCLSFSRDSALILNMQRLHESDLTGVLLRSESGWEHLRLPAIAPYDKEIEIGPGQFYHWRAGEALHPAREPLAVLERLRLDMGSARFAAQYLQDPVPAAGNLIQRTWLKYVDSAPTRLPGGQIVQSWDIAATLSDRSDYSVCTTWLRKERNYYLLHVWRGRLEYPMLKPRIVALAVEHHCNVLLIENVGAGQHLVQELRGYPVPGVPIPHGIRPESDKLTRMATVAAARFEAGQVFFPKDAPWLADLEHELLSFPNGAYDDQVDSVSQFLNWAEREHAMMPMVGIYGPQVFRG